MVRVRLAALALSVLAFVVVVGTSTAADKAQKLKGKFGGVAEQLTRLLPDGAEEKLKLSDEQKKQLATIAEDYKTQSRQAGQKLRDALAKNQAAIKKARQDKDKVALKDAAAALREPALEARKLRDEARAKVKAVLNDEQKKTFEEILKEEPGIAGKIGKVLEKKKKKDNPE